ncbi:MULTISPECIES: hypothetical protein [Vibrio]|uniref:hypothetical protein n=1 Tax=Vibrio TaxID=662 RepID=UPI0007EEA36E|nr:MULTISPECIES: hypothetical protein [Vibrio]NOH93061.1 hypothetical protein [Vibrio sp. AIC-3]OBT07571.1 hypothetical protein A9265_14265 [Vibrio cyclitrophicus]PMM07014.1 hypothetical protein BCT63_05320 [Vibrio kanaloae]RPF57292.1 hypothetical protein EDB61_105194 [Vibrio crassostreae]TCV59529.1 hypothetical protein EDB74_111154 [Vibrio crassostreae]
MSEALKVAAEAPDYIETLLVEMLQGDYPDNEVLLGTLLSGDESIQIQLKITRKPEDFLDEC